MKKIVVTGVAGFIGMHVAARLLDQGFSVFGIDSLNDYYDVNLKNSRLEILLKNKNFQFTKLNIANKKELNEYFIKNQNNQNNQINQIVHLAAQAGVRYSIKNPDAYGEANLVGFLNIIELSRKFQIEHLVFASSSSVYGSRNQLPFSEDDKVDCPVSLYAATKKANEVMAYSYSHLYGTPITGLRFFTVYGPWGRPDMSPSLFAKSIFEEKPIRVFNNGDMFRDFTYIDDVVESVVRVLEKAPLRASKLSDTPATDTPPYKIFNIGNNSPVNLLAYISIMERIIGKKAVINFEPLQSGDLYATSANTNALKKWIDFSPTIDLEIGLVKFIDWIKYYYKY